MEDEILDDLNINNKLKKLDSNEKIELEERIPPMILDFFIGAITFLPVFLCIDYVMKSYDYDSRFEFYMPIGIALFLLKDILNGKSIAKRAFGFKVIDIKTGKAANGIQCVVRNITYPFSFIEAFFILNNPSRRLGDILVGTKVIKSNKVSILSIISEIKNINIFKTLLLPFFVSLGCSLFLLHFFGWLIYLIDITLI
jgi:uncharacterized RDD family membrane protein YckC